ncbi:glutamate-5-semialdehyde dehydrogenase [Gardnerella sp. 2492-Sm]|uniref:glutamate-5-semialdehyde dehydrogenase n=1 Tax=unclassified Gardnerella TaxID=2628112 RepID=UPI003D066A95
MDTRKVESSQSSQSAELNIDAVVCKRADLARVAQRVFAHADTQKKNKMLEKIADTLEAEAENIAKANKKDIQEAQNNGMDAGKLDRLKFDEERIKASAKSVRKIAQLQDPVGQVVRGYTLPNGIKLSQVRVPMGVMGMIYEARPNVTIDVAALCIKSGNAAILRGGSAAENTNKASINAIQAALSEENFNPELIQSVDDLGRAGATAMMHAHGHIDVLVPRGSANLIAAVVKESTVPVIETGAGNVHIYVDKSADITKAIPIVINAKTQRVGVCNAAEKLLVHRDVAQEFLPKIAAALAEHNVILHADDKSYEILQTANIQGLQLEHATDEDWKREYLSLNMGIKVVENVDDAANHIAKYSTGHTETIIAEDYSTIQRFISNVDSAVVMVNASTRFTDGGEFGFGAELGISTQKLHARGPMGLQEMTTTKWIGYGEGQIRS